MPCRILRSDDLRVITQSFEQQGTWANRDITCFKYCDALRFVDNVDLIGWPEEPYTCTTTSIARYQFNPGFHHSWAFSVVAEYHCNENGEWIGELKCCLGGCV